MEKINQLPKMLQGPLLIKGDIMHHRFFPKTNSFRYKSTYISFPISKIKSLKKTLFSLNGFNFFGFFESDYGDNNRATEKKIDAWINSILAENNISNISEIVLVSHPRVLGYAFNPVSFWLCMNAKNELIAVLSEVNNTCGQKHNYLCFKDDLTAINSNDWLESKKEFYVSPFMKVEGNYKFRFEYLENHINFYINYVVDDQLKLSTSLKCSFKEFSNKNLLLSFAKMPFFTFKTVILIHYQALKLYLKSIKFYPCPKDLDTKLTIGKNEK